MPISPEGTYEIIDGRGIRHKLTIRYRERIAMFLYYLDERQIIVMIGMALFIPIQASLFVNLL